MTRKTIETSRSQTGTGAKGAFAAPQSQAHKHLTDCRVVVFAQANDLRWAEIAQESLK